MKNIHVLKTDKPSRLLKDLVDETYQFKKEVSYGNRFELPLNIYITSNEEIKEGDWIITKGTLVQANLLSYDVVKGSKVILTTDQDLIKDGVQVIDDEFLEWFVKNPSCEWVEVVYRLFNPMGRQVNPNDLSQNHSKCIWKYKITIPKEEPKQETLEELALRLYPENWESIMEGQHDSNSYERNAFINGYKVAQKQFKNK